MKIKAICLLLLILALLPVSGVDIVNAKPPTKTPKPTKTPRPTRVQPTPTPTITPTNTFTPTPTHTSTPIFTRTPTPTMLINLVEKITQVNEVSTPIIDQRAFREASIVTPIREVTVIPLEGE